MKRSILSVVCIMVFLSTSVAYAKPPSIRKEQADAMKKQEVQKRVESLKNPPSARVKPKIFSNQLLKFSVQYPDTWDYRMTGKDKKYWDERVVFTPTDPRKQYKVFLEVWVKQFPQTLTMKDLQTYVDNWSKQPKNSYQLENMPFIQNYSQVDRKEAKWKEFPAVTHVYKSEGNEKWEVTQLLIGKNKTLFVLNFRSTTPWAKEELPRFKEFQNSFKQL